MVDQPFAERDRHQRRIDHGQVVIDRAENRHQMKDVAWTAIVGQRRHQQSVDARTGLPAELHFVEPGRRYASSFEIRVTQDVEQFKRYVAADVSQGAELLKSAGFKPE